MTVSNHVGLSKTLKSHKCPSPTFSFKPITPCFCHTLQHTFSLALSLFALFSLVPWKIYQLCSKITEPLFKLVVFLHLPKAWISKLVWKSLLFIFTVLSQCVSWVGIQFDLVVSDESVCNPMPFWPAAGGRSCLMCMHCLNTVPHRHIKGNYRILKSYWFWHREAEINVFSCLYDMHT